MFPRLVLPEHSEWVTLYDLAWKLAKDHIREASGRRYIDAAWDGKRNFQWVWDTCFVSQYTRYAPHLYPGIEGLDNFYALQREDGFIAMTYDLDSGQEPWPGRINPPLFAWAEWNHFRFTGDDSRLARAANAVGRFMEWVEANRRTAPHSRLKEVYGKPDPYQLFYFEDCGSSGMDDAPRTPRDATAGRYFDWVDLSSQMALSYRMLALIAGQLGDARQSAWAVRAAEIGELVNAELWCESDRFYHDRMLPRNFVSAKTIAGFWPLLAGYCPPDRVAALVEHLLNPAEFARSTPVPSLSADDPNYRGDGVFWRGGVWAPANYMVLKGLDQGGRRDVAHRIARAYVEGLVRVHAAAQPASLWECIAPDRDLPGRKPYSPEFCKPDFVGWSGLGPISMLIEHVIGIEVDAVDATVTWDLRLDETHGVEALPVGAGHSADLLYDHGIVTVRSTRDLTLRLIRGETSTLARVVAGVPLAARTGDALPT